MDKDELRTRLQELAELKDGWYNGDGIAPDPQALKKLEDLFLTHFDATLTGPLWFPTPEGNILGEWPFTHHDVSLDVDLKDFSGRLTVLDMKTHEDWSFDISLTEGSDGWRVLNDEIRRLGTH